MNLSSSSLDDLESVAATRSAEPALVPATVRAARPRGRFGPDEANGYLSRLSPWTRELGLTVDACSPLGAVLRLPRNPRILRSGGAVSGHALLACADAAMAVAIMGHLGELRDVVTVTIAVDFMRAIADGEVAIAATVRRCGGTLVFTECTFIGPGISDIAVHATATWAFVPAVI